MSDKDKIILEIAKRNLLVRPASVCKQYIPPLSQDLTPTNSGADFYEVSVTSVKQALEAAYKAGHQAGTAETANRAWDYFGKFQGAM